MTSYLRSIDDHDTHHGELTASGTVTASCGIRFKPRPLPLAPQLMSSALLDTLENVCISFLLPPRQVIPVCHVAWLRIWEMLEDLPDPAESYKASLL
jgi:hypothetical protein